MNCKTLEDLDISGKRVLTRVDLNAPIKDGRVTDDARLAAIAPTVLDTFARGGRPIILAHFGRPEGEVVPEMSLRVVQDRQPEILDAPILFVDDCPESQRWRVRRGETGIPNFTGRIRTAVSGRMKQNRREP